jgi:hypothetical protein
MIPYLGEDDLEYLAGHPNFGNLEKMCRSGRFRIALTSLTILGEMLGRMRADSQLLGEKLSKLRQMAESAQDPFVRGKIMAMVAALSGARL